MTAHYQFDAYSAYTELKRRYSDFLLDHFGIQRGPLEDLLRQNWTSPGTDPFRLFAPLIVQGAFPFQPVASLDELQAPSPSGRTYERPLHPKTVAILKRARLDFPLYEHQVRTIRAACDSKTVVLAAGTGSGKTESFMIPLIDRLFWDHEEGSDDLRAPGVRAIIVYPLNALVNNQVERLRKMLLHQHDITFAYYTSRLKEEYGPARRLLDRQGRKPHLREIIDRQTLRGLVKDKNGLEGPPHILVTNYSMLEYMLIRPKDRSIFLPERLYHKGTIPRLKAVVLDEAHIYAGAQAAEIHMLLRRTACRFGTSLDRLQGYATSATLTQGELKDGPEGPLAEFAAAMFAKPRAQIAAIDGERWLPPISDVERQCPPLHHPHTLPSTDLIPTGLYTLEYAADGTPNRLATGPELATFAASACLSLGIATKQDIDALNVDVRDCPALLLHGLLSTHPDLVALRSWLFAREQDRLPTLAEVAMQLYGPDAKDEASCRAAEAVLRLASLARRSPHELPYIPARMHAMVRAPLGVWVDPRRSEATTRLHEAWPWGDISSMPPDPDDATPRLELLLCPTCGAPYLGAWLGVDGEVTHKGAPELRTVLIAPDPEGVPLPDAFGAARVRIMHADREGWNLKAQDPCIRCGDGMNAMRRLRLNPRSAMGAIVDSIYPHLGEMPPAADGEGFRPGGGRRLLSFSDSRQKAAEVATRVEITHDTGLNRQLLWHTIHLLNDDDQITDLIDELACSPTLRQRAPAAGLPDDSEALSDLARISVYEEFARPPASGKTLETIGLVEVVYPNLPRRPAEVTFLSDNEWKDFLADILDDARRRGAVRMPIEELISGHSRELTDILPNTIGKVLCLSTGAASGTAATIGTQDPDDDPGPLIPFLSTRSQSRPFQYTKRVLEAVGHPPDMDAEKLLRLTWDLLADTAKSPRCKWLRYSPPSSDGKPESLTIKLPFLKLRAHDAPSFIEPASHRVYFRSVRGVCRDKGTPKPLERMNEEDIEVWRARHPVRRVTEDPMIGLWSVEHTAQIDVEDLEQEEEAYRQGRRNLLASSTTMEMGVDLGGLTFVLLTNVPPSPSNYWQRAGRAGRRADGSSMVLTLALGRPHDQRVFIDPRRFLHEPVTPPRVRLDTRPLIQRHVNAFLLSTFFEEALLASHVGNPIKSFGLVQEFVFSGALEVGGIDADLAAGLQLTTGDPLAAGFLRWLNDLEGRPHLVAALNRLVQDTDLADSPISSLTADCGMCLDHALVSARQDYEHIKAQRAEEELKGEGLQDRDFLVALGFQERSLLTEPLIGYLARSGFLPRFGFPIDVVRLDTRWRAKKRKDRKSATPLSSPEETRAPELRMERDLAMALSEYAPGAEVIAAKRVYRVAGVTRNWMRDDAGAVEKQFYFHCVRCGHSEVRKASFPSCPVCAHPVQVHGDFVSQARAVSRKERSDRRKGIVPALHDEGETPPSPLRNFLQPSGFAVKFGLPPKQLGGDLVRMPFANVSLMMSAATDFKEILAGRLAVCFASESRLFVRSDGRAEHPNTHGFGYRICRLCGYTEPESDWETSLPPTFARHYQLRGTKRCPMTTEYWRHAVLGTTTLVDTFRVRLLGDLAPRLGPTDLEDFTLTFATCLQQQAAEFLRVDPRTLNATVGTWQVPPELRTGPEPFAREAILYEEAGSGMLALVADNALDLVRRTVRTLEEREAVEFIRFETQFLVAQGRLRLDLLRQHFFDPGIGRILLEEESFLEREDVHMLRGKSPRLATAEFLNESSSVAVLQAPRLAEDALENEGVLRPVLKRALADGDFETRLLLSELPDVDSGEATAFLLAERLRRLLVDGVHVRLTHADDATQLATSPWRVLAFRHGAPIAIGGLVSTESNKRGVGVGSPAFGSSWLQGVVPVEARPVAAGLAWEEHETLWQRASPVDISRLVPRTPDRIHFLPIAQGATGPEATTFEGLFASCGEHLGPLRDWGEVEALAYMDRYVTANPIALWMLDKLLSGFTYAPGARVVILHERPRRDRLLRNLPGADILNAIDPPRTFTEGEEDTLKHWCRTRGQARGGPITFKQAPARAFATQRMRHPRKLLVKFATGGRVKTLKVLFEHGLDWVRPVPGAGAWCQRAMQAQESHVVILIDHPLEAERDERGQSEWERLFGRL